MLLLVFSLVLTKHETEVVLDIIHDNENISHAFRDKDVLNLHGVHIFFHLAQLSHNLDFSQHFLILVVALPIQLDVLDRNFLLRHSIYSFDHRA